MLLFRFLQNWIIFQFLVTFSTFQDFGKFEFHRVLIVLLGFCLLSERSEAFSLKDTSKWFRFFPILDNLLRFFSSNFIFRTCLSDLSVFCMDTMTRSRSIIGHFWARYWRKKFNFRTFHRTKAIYFDSCLYNKLGNAIVFELIDETPFSWAWCCGFWRAVFKINQELFEFFETDLTFPIAHCVS